MERQLICYCFEYSEEDIIKDVIDNRGRSSIQESIQSEKKNGRCNCRFNHPEGR